jgi:hypothetical protein
VIDLGADTAKNGHGTATMDRIAIRAADDDHVTVAGDVWLSRWRLPPLETMGVSARLERPPTRRRPLW